MKVHSRQSDAVATVAEAVGTRPVLLVTSESGFDGEAERVAVASALDNQADLFLVDMIDIANQPCSTMLGSGSLASQDERAAVHRTAETAAALGLRVQILNVRSPRPPRALGELVAEYRPGLLVYGPSRPPRGRRGRRLQAAVREASCLVWLADAV